MPSSTPAVRQAPAVSTSSRSLVAAAIGAGIDITKPDGHMVVDIGGGTSDIAVISLSGVVESASIKIAGDKFNEAVVKYMRRKHNVLVGERTAEQMKIEIGCVYPQEEEASIEIKGRCLVTGLPKTITVHSSEMLEAFEEPVERIMEAIHCVLERTPPELVADVSTNGIIMTGGGSLVYGFDKLVTARTGIHTVVAEDAISCVAEGTGKSLDSGRYAGRNGESVPQKTDELRSIDLCTEKAELRLCFSCNRAGERNPCPAASEKEESP